MSNQWQQALQRPAPRDHIVQVYQDQRYLADAVGEYIGTGLARGEAAIVIARPEHNAAFLADLERRGANPQRAQARAQLVVLDAQETLDKFMVDGWPLWTDFRECVGGLISRAGERFPAVRAYGEMVDILWQKDSRETAIALEGFWNELAKIESFSLFCAYRMDPLDNTVYGGPLESVCGVHTHLIPTREYEELDTLVHEASNELLDPKLAGMLLSISAAERIGTKMPQGQATLLWLQRNMPRTADKILASVRRRRAARG